MHTTVRIITNPQRRASPNHNHKNETRTKELLLRQTMGNAIMLKRLIIVSFVLCIGMTSGTGYAANQIVLTSKDVASLWRNINTVVLVLAANVALEDEWIQGVRDLKPDGNATQSAQAVTGEMLQFHEKLNVLLASSQIGASEAITISASAPPNQLYITSGEMLDLLVSYLIASDSLASVAIYYADTDTDAVTDQDLAAEVNLANQRIAALLEETGL